MVTHFVHFTVTVNEQDFSPLYRLLRHNVPPEYE